jgi:hypothetical protein
VLAPADNTAMEVAPKRRRRWLQFRLRTLMICVTLFCAVGGWFGNQVRMVRERKAMAFRPSVDSVTEARNKLPWLRVWLGDEYFKGLLLDRSVVPAEEFDLYKDVFPEATILQRESSDYYELHHRLHNVETGKSD